MACWQTLWYESWFVSIWSLWYMMSGIWVPSQNWFRHLYLVVLFQVLLIFLWLICKSTVVVPCYVGGHVVCGVNEGLVAGQTFVFYSGKKKQYMLDHNIFASEWSLNLACVTWETLAIFLHWTSTGYNSQPGHLCQIAWNKPQQHWMKVSQYLGNHKLQFPVPCKLVSSGFSLDSWLLSTNGGILVLFPSDRNNLFFCNIWPRPFVSEIIILIQCHHFSKAMSHV